MATRFLVLVMFILAVVASSAMTVIYLDRESANSASSAEVSEQKVKKVVAEFIEENPEVIVEGLRKAQMKKKEQERKQAKLAVKEILPKVEEQPNFAGNPEGKVTMAVFHDYNCGFCRKAIPDVEKVMEEYGDEVNIVMIDLPILGELSVQKAEASIAVGRIAKDKWFNFYKEISAKRPKNIEQIYQVAADLGIDTDQLKEEMKSDVVDNIIQRHRSFASQLGVRGTPAFMIGDELVRGAVGFNAFKGTIEEQLEG